MLVSHASHEHNKETATNKKMTHEHKHEMKESDGSL